jgi:DNA-binding transcriptional MerR regulator
MFSIGEFARLGGVSVRTLRHYDEIGLLRPATVDPDTGYRGYSAARLGQISRIIALKELGLSLAQVRRLLDGVTLGELRGMLLLRRAQFEHEVDQHTNQLLGVEARLSSIAKEDGMPDDIVAKTIPFDQLGIHDRVKEAGPRIIFYEREHGEDVTVFLALPVTEPPAELPAPALYRVLPEVEAAVAVRRGPAASIFPMVYQDLGRWIEEHGYHFHGPGREVCGSTTKRPHGPWPAGIQDPAAIHPLCSHR